MSGIAIGANNYAFTYDVCCNLLTENVNRRFSWDAGDRLLFFKNQVGSSQPTVETQYLYDAAGKRVKKITHKAGGLWEIRVYIDGLFEYYTDEVDVQNTVHIMDEKSRVATVRIGAAMGDTTPALKYELENNVMSSMVLLDSSGAVVNSQEYYPFGETSFGSYGKKRYQYVGKERDEESGLYYYGARYYPAWTCRFISVDPLASKYANLTPYNYADNNPINDYDIDGMQNNNSSGTPMAAPTGSGGGVPQGNTGTAPNSTTAKTDVSNALQSYTKPLSPTDKTTVETKKVEIKKDNIARDKTIDFTKLESKQPDRLYDASSYDSPYGSENLPPGVAEGQIHRKAFDATDNKWLKASIVANLSSQAISNFGGSVIGGTPGGSGQPRIVSEPINFSTLKINPASLQLGTEPLVSPNVRKVLNSLQDIKDQGGTIKLNPLNPANKQEINMTIQLGSDKLDLRIETHKLPLKYGGDGVTPQRHMNVDLYPKSNTLPNNGHKILN